MKQSSMLFIAKESVKNSKTDPDLLKNKELSASEIPIRVTPPKREISRALNKVDKFKKHIQDLKRKISIQNNEERFIQLKNQSSYLQKQIQEAEQEKKLLSIPEHPNSPQTHSNTSSQQFTDKLKLLKSNHKHLLQVSQQNEKIKKEKHEQIYKYKQKIQEFNNLLKNPCLKQVPSNYNIAQIQEKISLLENERSEQEKDYKKEAKIIEERINKKLEQINSLQESLYSKDLECRASVVNIRNQSRRNTKFAKSEPRQKHKYL